MCMGRVTMCRPDSDRVLCVAGVVDGLNGYAPVGRSPLRDHHGGTVVPCRRDDDDTGPDEPVDCGAERRLPRGMPSGVEGVTEAQVYAVNPVLATIVIQFLDLFQSSDQGARQTFSALRNDLEADDLRFGRKTENAHSAHCFLDDLDLLAVGPCLAEVDHPERIRVCLSCDDPGDMCAMTEFVGQRITALASQICMTKAGWQIEIPVEREVRMRAIDAAVRHGYDDVLTIGTEGVSAGIGFHCRRRPVQKRLHVLVFPDLFEGPRAVHRSEPVQLRELQVGKDLVAAIRLAKLISSYTDVS